MSAYDTFSASKVVFSRPHGVSRMESMSAGYGIVAGTRFIKG